MIEETKSVGKKRGSLRRQFDPAILFLLCASSLGLASWKAGTAELQSDELFSWRLTQYPVRELIARTGADVHPPLYYLLLKAWVSLVGDGPRALRVLSAFFGVWTVPAVFLLVREARYLGAASVTAAGAPRRDTVSGGLVASFIVAVHWLPVSAARSARMYALGAFLCVLSSWLLLRALRRPNGRGFLWWLAYGVVAGAFLYTHNYAIFTLAAHTVFVAGMVGLGLLQHAGDDARRRAAGFAAAAVLVLALYAPWLPTLRAQSADVRQRYWIPPASRTAVAATFWSWTTGTSYTGGPAVYLLLSLLGAAALWTTWRLDAPGFFFLLLAFVPWELALAVSRLSGQSILLDRCLLFAHVGLAAYLGVAWSYLPDFAARLAFVASVAVLSGVGTFENLRRLPSGPPPIAQAADFVRNDYRPDDVVVVALPSDVNQVRYYSSKAGLTDVKVRYRRDSHSFGHRVQVASLADDDFYRDETELESFRRIWMLGAPGRVAVPKTFSECRQFSFTDGRRSLDVSLLAQ